MCREPRLVGNAALGLSQRGFLVPLAAFIIVIMGLLALTIARFSGQSTLALAQEAISTQAFYAAESGAQYGMNQLFYDTGTVLTRALVDGNCTAVNGDTVNFSGAGLNNCSATISCSFTADAGNTTSFYTLASTGNCGSGSVTAQRTVQVAAQMQ